MKNLLLLFLVPFLCSSQNFDVDYIKNLVNKNYGDKIDFTTKSKTLRKFGRNTNLSASTEAQVWITGGIETLSTSNDITHIASSNAGDTQIVTIEGHTIDSNGDFTFVTQNITLQGQTKTALTTPIARATRAFNNGSTNFAGTIYIAKDVTFTNGVPASDISATINSSDNQTLKAATTISKNDYWIITDVQFSVRRQQTANVDFKIQVREKGKVFRTFLTAAVSNTSGSYQAQLSTPLIIRPNSDVRVMATSSANTTQVDAIIDGYLAAIVN